MSQIAASSLSRLRPVQPGQIISANLINLIIESHLELERRLQELERRREPPPPSGGGDTKPQDTGVSVRPKDEFARPKEEHTRPKEEHVRPKEEHVRPKEEHVRPKEEHVRPKEELVRPKEEQVRPKEEFLRPKDEVFDRDRIESIGPIINLAEIMDTDDGPVAVITGANLHNLDSVNIGNLAVDTSKAERIGDGIRIPLKGQAEIVRAIQDTNAISSISVSGAEGMAAKSVQFGKLGKLGRAGRIK